MLEKLMNNDLIITSRYKKISILKSLNKEKKLLNLKFKTKDELIKLLLGTYDEKAIYYLIKKYNYKFLVAKTILENFNYDEKLNQELIDNNLIIKENINYNRVVVIGEVLDPFILDLLKDKEIIYLNDEINNYDHPVYEFDTIEEEVNFVCIEIIKKLNEFNINKIKLVNVNEDYYLILKRMFKFYNIPINLNEKKELYGLIEVQEFIKEVFETKDIESSLNKIKDVDIKNTIIYICNKYYTFDDIDIVLYCIKEEIKNYKLNNNKLKNAVEIIDINDVSDENYNFIMSFNQGILPKIYKDEDFISDKEKKKLNIFTSTELNKIEIDLVKRIIKNNKNITLSYKLKSSFNDYYKSSLIEEDVIKIKSNIYSYSNIYNKILLTKKLDNLVKYNKYEPDLDLLYASYKDIPYLKYDNSYNSIDKDLLYKYLDNELVLSYSSIDNYYKCAFRYYISNILKLNNYEDTFMIYVGNLFHYILSICFNDNFDFEKEFNNYIKDKIFKSSEEFFINKLKENLKYVIDLIKYQDTYSNLNDSLYETRVNIEKNLNIKVRFTGVIDKLKYKVNNDKTIVAIIDYKTGNNSINLNNIIYGIDMQLPIYLLLTLNSNLKNISFAGFYLQKIINGNVLYQKGKDSEEELRKQYRLDGFSNSDTTILQELDNNYFDSNVIKGMKVSKNGFYAYSKVLNNEQIEKLLAIVTKKINESIDNILNSNFEINPKKIGKDLRGCEFCKFKDLCFKKEEDIVYLDEVNYKEVLGGE